MTDLQRYGVLSSDGEFVYMQKYDDGKWVLYDDAQAEIARLLLRIADLEAAEPVSAVLADQVLDVICGIGDCEIPPHMDPRRHAIHQCLIAAILHVARLREALERVTGERDEEKEIVSRVWEILGSPSFASLRGRSIYDLLQEIISARNNAQAEIARLRERETILNTTIANLHEEIARLQELVEAQHATIKTTAEALMTVGPGPDMDADINDDSPEDAMAWDLGIIVQELQASIAASEEDGHE